MCAQLTPLVFGDHHQFKKKDVHCINETFSALPEPKIIVTTEKDATRLTQVEGLSDEVRQNIYVLPIRIKRFSPFSQTKPPFSGKYC